MFEPPGQISAPHVFHGIVVAVLQNSAIQNSDNARMRQTADYIDFIHESGICGRTQESALSQNLICASFTGFRIDAQKNLGHPTIPDSFREVKPFDFFSRRRRSPLFNGHSSSPLQVSAGVTLFIMGRTLFLRQSQHVGRGFSPSLSRFRSSL